MTNENSIQTIKLREVSVPEDYAQMEALFNLIEPGSTTIASLEEEDSHVPASSSLKIDENGHLVGFGRTRIIAETEDGKMIGYGACFRAPWVEPGSVGSTFCVHPDFRSQGVGELLLSHIEDWAKKHQASVLTSIVMDWIKESVPFVKKRGFLLDAHIFELELDVAQFNAFHNEALVNQVKKMGIQFTTLADLQDEASEIKLYELYVETSKDNPGQYGDVGPFEQWKKEFFPANSSREDWIFIAVDDRGRGIAKALKVIAINAAKVAGVKTITTDSEENNAPMQHINKTLGFLPGNGHYRIIKQLSY